MEIFLQHISQILQTSFTTLIWHQLNSNYVNNKSLETPQEDHRPQNKT